MTAPGVDIYTGQDAVNSAAAARAAWRHAATASGRAVAHTACTPGGGEDDFQR